MIVYAVYVDDFDDFVCLFETLEEAKKYISKQEFPGDYTYVAIRVMKTAEEAIKLDEED